MTKAQATLDAARNLLAETPLGGAGKFLQNLLLPEELDRIWVEAANADSSPALFGRFLDGLGVRYECSEDDLHRIPERGPVVVVANHPFGLIEGPILGALLAKIRPDTLSQAMSVSRSNVPIVPTG